MAPPRSIVDDWGAPDDGDDVAASASRALFLVPGSGREDETSRLCRVTYHESTGEVRIVSCGDGSGDFLDGDGDDDDNDRGGAVLDAFDPRDVIGAELEMRFEGADMAEEVARRVQGSFDQASSEEDGEDGDGRPTMEVPPSGADVNLSGHACTTDALGLADGDNQATAQLNVYCYPRRRPRGSYLSSWCRNPMGPYPSSSPSSASAMEQPEDPSSMGERQARHRTLEVAPCMDFADARAVVRAIRRAAGLGQFHVADPGGEGGEEGRDGGRCSPKKYLVVVNPCSGTGKARAVYESTVRPMLEQAGVDHDVLVTDHAGHATERMSVRERVAAIDEANEDMNEAEVRDILEYDAIVAMGGDGILFEILQGIRSRSDAADILSRVAFGVVGCGTSNGLAKSLLHACNEKYGALESTFLICKGAASAIDLSNYELAKTSYTGFLTFSWALVADIDIESECVRWLGSLRTDIWAVWRMMNLRKYRARFSYLPGSKNTDKTKPVSMPALNEPVPPDWETIEDDFILFWACQVTHASSDILNSPSSKMKDGLFQILVVRSSCSRLKLIQMFLKMESGGHVDHEECEIYDCVAYRLEPLVEGSFNDLDGEKIEPGPLQANVLPSAVQFFLSTPC